MAVQVPAEHTYEGLKWIFAIQGPTSGINDHWWCCVLTLCITSLSPPWTNSGVVKAKCFFVDVFFDTNILVNKYARVVRDLHETCKHVNHKRECPQILKLQRFSTLNSFSDSSCERVVVGIVLYSTSQRRFCKKRRRIKSWRSALMPNPFQHNPSFIHVLYTSFRWFLQFVEVIHV